MPSLGGIQKTMAHDESEIVVVTDKDSKTASAATQYFDEGYGLFQHGLPDLALKFFKQAVAEDPLYLDALFYSFRCYQKLDRSGKALQTLERLRDALVDPGSLNRERLRYVRTASNTYNQTPMQFAAIEKVKMLEIIGADLFRRERYRLAKQYDLESMRLLERVRRAPSPDKNRKLAKDYFAAGHYHHAIDFFNELKQ